jgi:hypothetical protein
MLDRSRHSRLQVTLPGWLIAGLLVVGSLAVFQLVVSKNDDRSGVAATALATVFLAAYTARLYRAAISQFRTSMRPLLIEVKPYAPPPADLSGTWDAKTGSHFYQLRFPNDFVQEDWDGRRPFVRHDLDGELHVSVILRNVGDGLALISEHVQIESEGHNGSLPLAHCRVWYPRLPPGESTRLNLVTKPVQATTTHERPIIIGVTYTDLSGQFRETARVRLERRPSRARTADAAGYAWAVKDITYAVSIRCLHTRRIACRSTAGAHARFLLR